MSLIPNLLQSPRASSILVGEEILSRGIPPGDGQQKPSLVTSLLNRSTSQPLLSTSSSPASTPTALHVVCTTRDIIWLDDRMPGKDLMRWCHGRLGRHGNGADRTLSLLEIPPTTNESGKLQLPCPFQFVPASDSGLKQIENQSND